MTFGHMVEVMVVSIEVLAFRGFKGMYYLRDCQLSRISGVSLSTFPEPKDLVS